MECAEGRCESCFSSEQLVELDCKGTGLRDDLCATSQRYVTWEIPSSTSPRIACLPARYGTCIHVYRTHTPNSNPLPFLSLPLSRPSKKRIHPRDPDPDPDPPATEISRRISRPHRRRCIHARGCAFGRETGAGSGSGFRRGCGVKGVSVVSLRSSTWMDGWMDGRE